MLKTGSKIGDLLLAQERGEFMRGERNGLPKLLLDGAEDGGFEAGKGEI